MGEKKNRQKKINRILLVCCLAFSISVSAQREVELRMGYGAVNGVWFNRLSPPIPVPYHFSWPAFTCGAAMQHKPKGLSFRVKYGLDYNFRQMSYSASNAETVFQTHGLNGLIGIEFRSKGKWQFRAGGGLRLGVSWTDAAKLPKDISFTGIGISSYADCLLAYAYREKETFILGLSGTADWSAFYTSDNGHPGGGSTDYSHKFGDAYFVLRWVRRFRT